MAAGLCPTGKFRYRDRIGALFALTGIDNADPKRREKRTYRCPACRGWHLTSQIKRQTKRRAGR
ncbi:hypothetical protein [Streptomyces sp. NPDC050534]|uniref:hypothetical protein n=1 Tax=Streptomyces sp. NPDC050534 TaxID=3365625 RepID=UPI003787F703